MSCYLIWFMSKVGFREEVNGGWWSFYSAIMHCGRKRWDHLSLASQLTPRASEMFICSLVMMEPVYMSKEHEVYLMNNWEWLAKGWKEWKARSSCWWTPALPNALLCLDYMCWVFSSTNLFQRQFWKNWTPKSFSMSNKVAKILLL